MKKFLIIAWLVCSFKLQAQVQSVDALMRLKPIAVGQIKVDTNVAVFLPMPFAEAYFFNLSQLPKIPSPSEIYAVELVYTRYREVDSFNQPELNKARYEALQKIYPGAFHQTDIIWRAVEQTTAKNKQNAAKCFHGFVIYLKNSVDEKAMKVDVDRITTILDSYKDTLIWVPEKTVWKVKRRKVETGNYIPKSSKKKSAGITYSKKSIWNREPEYDIFYDSTLLKKTGGFFKKIGKFDTSFFRGTPEFNLLAKRKWSDKMAVVTDVTGSMSPYSTQVMLWLKYNSKALENGRFTFFNDGDNTPDVFKKIGNTGGIYFNKNKTYDSVLNTMLNAMRRGLGGDWPENNLEAVIKTIQRWPDVDTVLLIADNDAAVKDLILLESIKIPVSVLLCGVKDRVHPDYIKITKQTGGHLFILETEISNIKSLKNNQKIAIGGHIFEYRNGGMYIIR